MEGQRVRQSDRPLMRLDWEKGLYVLVLVLALLSRLWGLGIRVQSHDESIHSRFSWNLYAGLGFIHDPMMHGPFLFHLTALTYFLFGDSDFTARLPVALIGTVLVVFPYLLRRWLGRSGALATSSLLLISPAIAYYSRYIRHDIPVALWAMVTFYALLSYLADGRARWLYIMAAGVSLAFATKEVSFVYHAIYGFFLVGLLGVRAWRRRWRDERLKPLVLLLITLALFGAAAALLGREMGRGWLEIAGGTLALLAVFGAGIGTIVGVWSHIRGAGAPDPALRRPADLIVVLGTLCLPFLSPLPIALLGLNPLDYTAPTIYYSAILTGLMIAISIVVGLLWDWRRWWIAAAIHYGIFLVLFTTLFTNGYGVGSGLVGSLGYWLQQHEVQRGNQPLYYYGVMVAFYEYLPLLLALAAVGYIIVRSWGAWRRPVCASTEENDIALEQARIRAPFVPFLLWWTLTAWLGYSIAGERMPWLTVHITLPMILLSGWLLGRWIDAVDWQGIRRQRVGWLVILAGACVLVGAWLGRYAGDAFRGRTLPALVATSRFLGGIALLLGLIIALVRHLRNVGYRLGLHVGGLIALLLLVVLTVRTTWRFCYINYDYPTELLVYAHGAPGVNEVMRRVDALSRRTAGDRFLIRVAYGSEGSTFFYWQLRNYPNAVFFGKDPTPEELEAPVIIAGQEEWEVIAPYVADNYVIYTFPYLWWPLEAYRGLTFQRVWHLLTDPNTRVALWDIWLNRDYRRYSELSGKPLTLDRWPYPYRRDVRLYVRRDVAAQMWEESLFRPAELGGVESTATPTPDPYISGWRDLTARLVFGTPGTEPGQLLFPRDIAVDTDGFIYVVEAGNHRVQKFRPDGTSLAVWGQQSHVEEERGGPQGFNEPWGIALGPDGTIWVADTWNHRIQALDAQGQVIRTWDRYAAPEGGVGGFYGPRDLVVGPNGRLYVTDTGNKLIKVFDLDGRFQFQWGGGGVLPGYLDEPVGIAIGPGEGCGQGGCIYVADTWNRRIQVFDLDGRYLRQWAVYGWEGQHVEHKPYLAVDAHGRVYVTDPGHYRVLVFDSQGVYLFSFGQYGFDERSFALPTGIAVGPDGSIYVTDAHGGRVLVYDAPPLE